MTRNIHAAATRIKDATPGWLESVSAHDPDMIRDVAAAYLAAQSPSLALAEENSVLREALDQLIKATTNLLIHVDTSTCGGALLTFYHEAKSAKDQSRAALSAARPSAQAYSEAFDDLLAAAKVTEQLVKHIVRSDFTDCWKKITASIARAEACK